MARDLGDIPDERGRRKRAWLTPTRLAGAGIFIIGLLIGIYAGVEWFQPIVVQELTQDLNNLHQVNAGLDRRLDGMLFCLAELQVDPDTCGPS